MAYERKFKESTPKKYKTQTIESLKALSIRLSKIKEEEDKVGAIDDVIDQIGEVVTDAIDTLGAGDPVVAELIDTASALDAQSNIAEIEDGEEVIMNEEDNSEDDKEEVKEEENSEDKDDKKEESFERYKPRFK